MKCKSRIAILMATYNGEKYLREQLDSILSQSYHDWQLFIHDDGSTDGTPLILRDYAARYPEKVVLLDYPSQGGACQNFESLLRCVEAEYYMFSDQDDVWLETKVEMEFRAASELEGKSGDAPLLIATDLRVVGSELQVINDSLWKPAGIYPQYVTTFDEMAANTLVTGCTMLFNDKAKQCSLPFSKNATMHDAWIACCTLKNNGQMRCIPLPTVLYRQHGGNTLGAYDIAGMSLLDRMKRIGVSYRINRDHYRMLKDLGYGSVLKYILYKVKYAMKIRNARFACK